MIIIIIISGYNGKYRLFNRVRKVQLCQEIKVVKRQKSQKHRSQFFRYYLKISLEVDRFKHFIAATIWSAIYFHCNFTWFNSICLEFTSI